MNLNIPWITEEEDNELFFVSEKICLLFHLAQSYSFLKQTWNLENGANLHAPQSSQPHAENSHFLVSERERVWSV